MIELFFSNKSELLKDAPSNIGCDSTYRLNPIPSDMIVGKDVMNDLEVFQPYDNTSFDTTLIHKLNDTQTIGGKRFVEDLIRNPIYDVNILEKRKACLETIGDDAFVVNKQHEMDFMWLHTESEETITDLLNSIYFNNFLTKRLNKSECALTGYNIYRVAISPVLGIVSPLIYFILPFLILHIKFGSKIQMSFTTYIKLLYKSMSSSRDVVTMFGNSGTLSRLQSLTYVLSLVFYFQGILNSTDIAYTSYKIINYLSDKINNAMSFLKSGSQFIEKNNVLLEQYARYYVHELDTMDTEMLTEVDSYIPYKKFNILSNFGKQLKIYKTIKRSSTLPLVNRCYLLDGIHTLKRCKYEMGLTYPTFVSGQKKLRFVSNDCWNIHLLQKDAVTNNVDLGNTVITGPNAGGKSTLIKMICTNVLLAQTIGLTSSSHTVMTPFYFINTQINIPDCKGHESLFEAEMNRCMYNLTTIEEHKDKPSLVVMDEIFNSTNVVEAISGAYSILHKMATFQNTLSLVTTHLTYLTKLKKTSNFDCYCMSVTTTDMGKIEYPYILKEGVCKQYIALELLKARGFSKDIIDKALQIKEKFIRRV